MSVATPTFEVAASEITRSFSGGAVRGDDTGKGAPNLLPFEALSYVWRCFDGANNFPMRGAIEISKVYQSGAKKYSARNWERGMHCSAFVDSAMRHFACFLRGQDDEPHCGQIGFNLLGLLQMQLWVAQGLRGEEFADLPNGVDAIAPDFEKIMVRPSLKYHTESALLALWQYVSYGHIDNCIAACAHNLRMCEIFYGDLEKRDPYQIDIAPIRVAFNLTIPETSKDY